MKIALEAFQGPVGLPLDIRTIHENKESAIKTLRETGAIGLPITILNNEQGEYDPTLYLSSFENDNWGLIPIETTDITTHKDIKVTENLGALKKGQILKKGTSVLNILENILNDYNVPNFNIRVRFDGLFINSIDNKFTINRSNLAKDIEIIYTCEDQKNVSFSNTCKISSTGSLNIVREKERLSSTLFIKKEQLNKAEDITLTFSGQHQEGTFKKEIILEVKTNLYQFQDYKLQSKTSLDTFTEANSDLIKAKAGDFLWLASTKDIFKIKLNNKEVNFIEEGFIEKNDLVYKIFRTTERSKEEGNYSCVF